MLKHFWPVIQADVGHGCCDNQDGCDNRCGCDDHCCYCGASLGAEHLPKCSIRQRTVVVELDHEIELIAWFPEAWSLDLVSEYYKGGVQLDLTSWLPGDGEQPAPSRCMTVTDIREATDEDEERLLEWPEW
ncbi:MAG: hypothetical protein ACO1RT_01975 [Planctomycetaceae bacterium]